MSTVHRQPGGGGAMGGLLQAVWRYRWLIAAAVLLGMLLGYGWASRQPTHYEGVSRMVMDCPPLRTVRPSLTVRRSSCARQLCWSVRSSSGATGSPPRRWASVCRSMSPRTPTWSRDRVVDSTAKGAAQLADSVILAYDQVVAQTTPRRAVAGQLRRLEARCERETLLANDVVEPAGKDRTTTAFGPDV